MRINIEVIDHSQQRYETVGDWYMDQDGWLQIRVSQLSNLKYSALVAIHELVEVLIEGVKRTGHLEVPAKLVEQTDMFDKRYEYTRTPDNEDGEPGAEPDCPVYQGHMAATAIEHMAAMILGVNYNEYEAEIASMSQEKKDD